MIVKTARPLDLQGDVAPRHHAAARGPVARRAVHSAAVRVHFRGETFVTFVYVHFN